MTNRRKGPSPAAPAVIIVNNLDYPMRHAAWFAKKQAAAATDLARAAGFHVVTIDSEGTEKLAHSLDEGAIKAGDLSLSIVDAATASDLDALVRAQLDVTGGTQSAEQNAEDGVGEFSPLEPLAETQSSDSAASGLWDELQPGALVLAAELDRQGAPECWYEAIVVKSGGAEFTLRWRDFPREGLLTRTRRHIAILHPAI